jgi:hypothetical protein
MKLVSKSGSEIELNQLQAAEYEELRVLAGHDYAFSTAFAGQLPSQRLPGAPDFSAAGNVLQQMEAARQFRKKEKHLARRREWAAERDEWRRLRSAVAAVRQTLPGMHPNTRNLLVKRWVWGCRRRSFKPWQDSPPTWDALTPEAKVEAEAAAHGMLARLTAGNWRKIRAMEDPEGFSRIMQHASPEAIAQLL